MRFLFSLLLVLLTHWISAAEIFGVVSSPYGPLAYARLSVPKFNMVMYSDVDGKFRLQGLPAGSIELIVSAEGFRTDTVQLNIISGSEMISLQIELSMSVQEVKEVTISAFRHETDLSDGVIAINVVSPKLFERNPTPSIFEAIGMVNGVRPQLQCNVCSTGDIHINGMEGPYTVIMIDDMPIVSALGTVYGLMGIPNSIIERVEIQKGPSAVMFGSEAVGGLINVITRRPENAPRFSFNGMGTAYQDYTVDLSYRFRIGKRATGLLSANSFLFDKRWDINQDNFTDVTLQKRLALFGKIAVSHRRGQYSSLAARYLYEDRWGGEMNWNKQFRGGDSIYGESIYTARFEIIGTTHFTGHDKRTKLNYSFIGHDQNSVYGNSMFLAEQYIGFVQLLRNVTFGRSELLMGAAVRSTFYDDNTVLTEQQVDSTELVNKPDKSWLPGVFCQHEYQITENTDLVTGLRYDYHSVHGSILSPRVNLKSILARKHTVRLGIGNGYRVVNLFSEDHAAFNGSREVVILEELRPERSWNANVNYDTELRTSWSSIAIDLNGFYNYFSNKIVADYFTDVEKVIFDNLDGYGICRGIGADLNMSFNFPLKASFGATWSDVFLMEHNADGILVRRRQIQTPELVSNFVLTYTLCSINTTIDLSGNVYSPMLLPVFENDYRPAYSPWFGIINLQVTTLLGDKWQLYGGVKNLLNYIPSSDPIMRPFDPFDKTVNDPVNNPNGYTFDPDYNYAPYQRIRAFLGVKFVLK